MKTRHNEHSPIIHAISSACTCGRWKGPQRGDYEPQGSFTLRAKTAHDAHLADIQTSQAELFPALTGLFVEGEAAQ